MGEVKRVSVSLKVDSTDELYWSLILPLQQNRQLASFLVTLLQAYKDDCDIHDLVDSFVDANSGINKLKGHIETLIDLQTKATRFVEDVNDSLGGNSGGTINNVFDTDDDVESTENVVSEGHVEEVDYTEKVGHTEKVGSVGRVDKGAQIKDTKNTGDTENVQVSTLSKPALSDGLGNQYEIINAMLHRLDNVEHTLKVIQSSVGYEVKDDDSTSINNNITDKVEETPTLINNDIPKVEVVLNQEDTKKEDESKVYLKSMLEDIFKG